MIRFGNLRFFGGGFLEGVVLFDSIFFVLVGVGCGWERFCLNDMFLDGLR